MNQNNVNSLKEFEYDFNRIHSLRLQNFRSYSDLKCFFDGRPVVLLGPNGSGKTNILEALSLLSPGRGLRSASFDQFRNIKGPSEWGIVAEVLSDKQTIKVSTGVSAGRLRGRDVKINDKKVTASDALPSILSLSWVTPSMDQIFMESPSARRRFLDRMCSSFNNNHINSIKNYEKLMKERNKLLQDNFYDKSWLGTIEERMVSEGILIALTRIELIKSLNNSLEKDHNPVWPRAFLKIQGNIENKLILDELNEVKKSYKEILFNNRKKDSISGRTLEGIHRSDLLVSERNKGVFASQCSTGEQKGLLLGLILTHLDLIAEKSCRYPILLLDEVVAHLDQLRRSSLFDQIIKTKAQVFMTGTDISLFSSIENSAEFFSVGMGRLKEVQ
ncbi:MAG: DNA replication/repair protein RecF [Alphaproteobacteria bacterium]